MKQFTGRDNELRFLEQYYGKDGCRIVVVYGGRGVGKTCLLGEFCRDKKSFYYQARACSDREQCCQWSGELEDRGVGIGKYPDYAELLAASLGEEAGKQVLVVDEFHHMIRQDSAFFAALVKFLEDRLMSRSVMVVLCTSASGWVENHLVGRLKGLASSISGFLKIRELKFADIRRLYPQYSLMDSIRGYAVLGGNPGHWNCFDQTISFRENLIRNLLRRESRLYEEMEFFLEQELREPGVYNTILTAMARDCCKLNDIYRHTGFSRAKISVYLKNLMELELVEKVFSYDTEGRENARKGVYRIANPYVRFYFRYLFPNQSMLQLLEPEEFYGKYVAESIDRYTEEAYRIICREEMAREYRVAGEWQGKKGMIDIVASDGSGALGAAACVFSRKMEYQDYEWLRFSMKKAKISCSDIRLYCERGFEDALLQEEKEGRVKLCGITGSEG